MSARRSTIKPRLPLRLLALESRIVPSTYTVTNGNNSGSGSLRQAVTNANNHAGADRIEFSSYFNSPRTITLASQISITGPVTIDGTSAANVTISGNDAAGIFRCVGAPAGTAISFLDLTLKLGRSFQGAAIFGDDEALSVNRCIFLDNFTEANGGAIFSGGPLTVADSVFDGNGAVSYGGAIACVSLTATDTVFTGNYSYSTGGAVSAVGPTILTRCNISGNSAYYSGGGVNTGALTLDSSTVSGNLIQITGGYYGYYPGSGGGLGISGTATIRNSTISGNSAGYGAGIYATPAATLTVQNSTITGNWSNYGPAGGIWGGIVGLESSIVALNGGSEVTSSMVSAAHSLVYSRSGITTFNDLGGNRPAGENPRLGPLQDNGGPTKTHLLLPGSPCINSGSNTSNLTTDQRGFARVLDGTIDMGAAEGVDAVPMAGIVNAPSIVMTAGATDFAVVVRYDDDLAIDLATIGLGDLAVTGPGYASPQNPSSVAIAGTGAAVTVTYMFPAPGGVFDFIDAGVYTIGLAANEVGDLDEPAVHFVPASTLGTFRVAIPGTVEVDEVSDIDDGNVSDGHVSLREAVRLTNAAVNTADTIVFDPAVFGSPRTITLTGQLSVTDTLTFVGPGAVLLTLNAGGASRHFDFNLPGNAATPALSGLSLINGGAATHGGAIYSNMGMTLSDVTISNCRVGDFSGYYTNGGGAVYTAGLLTATNCSFAGNSSSGYYSSGGAIFANGGLILESSTVSGNQSVGAYGYYGYYPANGGGICVSGSATIRNCTISGNSANAGGGLSANTLLLQNSTITRNTLNSSSGGISNGGGILANAATITSSIVAANGAGDDVRIQTAYAANSLIFNRSGINTYYDLGGNRPAGEDPMLAPLADNGGPTKTHALLPGSPCIDAGSNSASLNYDQRGAGFARVSGSAADIGAFEVQGTLPPAVATTIVGNGSIQRSRVADLTVAFNTQVDFAGTVAAAFTLTRAGGGAVNFTATASLVGGATVVTLNNFTGGETEFGSLRDGRYTLTVLANQVSANGQQMASNAVVGDDQGLFRLFGDVNGDRRIDIADFGALSATYNKASPDPAFNSVFDFNNDGRIDIADFGQFSVRYFTSLP